MFSEHGFDTTLERIKQFEELPNTDEKMKIMKSFINDEISHLEYMRRADEYLKQQGVTNE